MDIKSIVRSQPTLLLTFTALLLMGSAVSDASETAITTTEQSVTSLTTSTVQYIESTFGITTEQYAQYLDLMENTVAKFYYPNLLPIEVLGFMAETDKDRERYALIYAQQNYDRAGRELAFMRATKDANETLFPGALMFTMPEPHLQTASQTDFGSILSGRYSYFTDIEMDNLALSKVLPTISEFGDLGLDIYLLGNITETDAQQWAASMGISQSLVNQSIITLNFDEGRLSRVAGNDTELPFLTLFQEMQSTTVSLDSL